MQKRLDKTTVLGLLLGIGRIAVLIATLVTASCGRQNCDHPPPPKTQIASFKVALDLFQTDCGRFPSTAEGLAALTIRPAAIAEAKWHGAYLEAIPKDAWGHDYVYRYPGVHNINGFDLYSLGPDGFSKRGGDDPDDVANWPQAGSQR
jgi:general secretion pathway protein G